LGFVKLKKYFKYKFEKRKSLVLEEDDTFSPNSQTQPIKRNDPSDTNSQVATATAATLKLVTTSPNSCKQVTTSVISAKKLFDHSNYWKIVAQDFAKKLDDSAREKDIHKEQASG
jgi:hypothetical protein